MKLGKEMGADICSALVKGFGGGSGEEAGWGSAEKEVPGRGAGALTWTLDGNKAKPNVGPGSHHRDGLLHPARCHRAKRAPKRTGCPGSHTVKPPERHQQAGTADRRWGPGGAGKMKAEGLL